MIDLIKKIIIPTQTEFNKNFLNRLNGETKEINKENIKKSFSNPQRFYEKTIDNKKYLIDSASTAINATWYALTNYSGPIILIGGGVDKKEDYSCLNEHIEKIRYFINISPTNTRIENYFLKKGTPTIQIPNIRDSIHYAKDIAKAGETILASPGHASFDIAQDNEDRTKKFIESIREI